MAKKEYIGREEKVLGRMDVFKALLVTAAEGEGDGRGHGQASSLREPKKKLEQYGSESTVIGSLIAGELSLADEFADAPVFKRPIR